MGRAVSSAGARNTQIVRPDAAVENWRRTTDRHNRWKVENPRPSHHRSSAARQAPAPVLTSILLTALLAGAHIAEARATIASSPNRTASRRAEGVSSRPPGDGANALSSPDPGTRSAAAVTPAGKAAPMPGSAASALDGAALPLRFNRTARSTSKDGARPELHGDLPLTRESLLGSRVLAARDLLGSAAEGMTDSQVLEIANAIHRRSLDKPSDEEAAQASAMLFRREGQIWAEKNGAGIMGVSEERALEVFQETWERLLNPPPPPRFRHRSEFREAVYSNTTSSPVFYSAQIDYLIYTERRAGQLYFTQFYDYLSKHADRYCKAKVMELAVEGGLGRFLMEYSPDAAWKIDEVSYFEYESFRRPSLGGMKLPVKRYLADPRTPLFAFSLPDGRHGIILPSGAFRFLPEDSIGKHGIRGSDVLDALREDVLRHHIDSPARKAPFGQDQAFTIRATFSDKKVYNKTIRELMERAVCENVRKWVEGEKREKYDYTNIEAAFDILIPFFETLKHVGVDPAYKVKLEDLAWDFLNLGLMTASFWGGKMLSAARKAAKGSSVVRIMLKGKNVGRYLFKNGHELNNLVMPSRTARRLALAPVRTGGAAAGKALIQSLARSDDLLAAAVKSDDVLDAIYKHLAKTWWGGKQTPQAIKAEIDAGAAEQIPAVLYRGQRGTEIVSSWGTVGKDRLDDYLAAIIKHSARAGGSAGEAFSLTIDKSVALRFIRHKDQGKVLAITTANDPKNFRTIESILKYDGPRLVKEKKITSGTLASAIRYAVEEGEKEIFYVGGSIPSSWITVEV